MTLTRALLTIAGSGLVCGVVGCLVGAAIGSYAPDAYRAVLPEGLDFSPAQFGAGQGLIQGLLTGIVVGVLVVAILAWRDVRIAQTAGRAEDA